MALKNKFNASNKSLEGKSVVFTGELSKPRRVFTAIAKEMGAEVKTSVSKNTDLVVAGADAGQKLQKAAKLGVRIVSEGDFFQIIKKQRAADKREVAKAAAKAAASNGPAA